MSVSKLAKKPIVFSGNVKIEMKDSSLFVSAGSRSGYLPLDLNSVKVDIKDGSCSIGLAENPTNQATLGTTVSKLKNLIRDCQSPYKSEIKLIGVGFKAFMANDNVLVMSVGFSHFVAFQIPDNIEIKISKDLTEIQLFGFVDDVTVFVDDICKSSPWNPCLQRGVVKKGSFLRRKQGKKK